MRLDLRCVYPRAAPFRYATGHCDRSLRLESYMRKFAHARGTFIMQNIAVSTDGVPVRFRTCKCSLLKLSNSFSEDASLRPSALVLIPVQIGCLLWVLSELACGSRPESTLRVVLPSRRCTSKVRIYVILVSGDGPEVTRLYH